MIQQAEPRLLKKIGSIEFYQPSVTEVPPSKLVDEKGPWDRRLAACWNKYGGELRHQAEAHLIPLEAALAVFITEAGGSAYVDDLVIIRYEDHIFRRETGEECKARRGGQKAEWGNLARAAEIDEEAAFLSTSFGLPQLMGFNYGVTNFLTPQQMAVGFQTSVIWQISGFFQFVKANKLSKFIRNKNWREFVRRYNGPGQIDYYCKFLTQYLDDARRLVQEV